MREPRIQNMRFTAYLDHDKYFIGFTEFGCPPYCVQVFMNGRIIISEMEFDGEIFESLCHIINQCQNEFRK